jgi:hypothetical protein
LGTWSRCSIRRSWHLRRHEIADPPEVVVGDAGYWHTRQIQAIAERGIEVLVPPDGAMRGGQPTRLGGRAL